MKKISLFIIFFYCFSSVFSQGIVKGAYHNITARYNAYFVSKEKMKVIENNILKQQKWDFSEILPIFPIYDTTFSKSLKTDINYVIEKSSIAIQRHASSKWADDCYILVGKARMYGSEFTDAIETFKWVNTNGNDENDKHLAIIYLMKTFIEAKEMKNANAVRNYLISVTLNKENSFLFNLVCAYYFQKVNNYELCVEYLTKLKKYYVDKNEKARLIFITGQIYRSLESDSLAYDYFKKALKYSETYEMVFHSQLYMAQSASINNSDDIKKTLKYFDKLIKDPKNEDFKDKIYYEIGNFYFKRKDLEMAVTNYKLGLKENKNEKVRLHLYLTLANIYYDHYSNFEMAKFYYDSTLNVMSQEEKFYPLVKLRVEILEDFIKYYSVIKKNDSLLSVIDLDKSSENEYIEKQLDMKEEAFDLQKKREREEKRILKYNVNDNIKSNVDLSFVNEESTGTWYFYNISELSKSTQEFNKYWGDRPLEDNWRRSKKVSIGENKKENKSLKTENLESKEEEVIAKKFDRDKEREAIMQELVSLKKQRNQLIEEKEVPYFELGKVYNLKLKDNENSIICFNYIIDDYPNSIYRSEVLYQLFLIYKDIDYEKSEYYKELLLKEFPNSILAKLAENPNYLEEKKVKSENFRKAYEKAYSLHKENDYENSQKLIYETLLDKDTNEYRDNLELLKTLNYAQIESIYKYQAELNNFIKNYPQSDLVEYAQLLLEKSKNYQIELFSSSKAKYKKQFKDVHYFIMIFNSGLKVEDTLIYNLIKFKIDKNLDLEVGSLVLDDKNTLILVEEFPGKESANTFKNLLFNFAPIFENKKEQVLSFTITKENFEILFKSKDIGSYKSFYETYYP